MDGERRSIDAGLLFRGKGIEFSSHTVDTVEDMIGPAVAGSFEHGMFDEMGYSLSSDILVAGADIDIDTRMGDDRIVLAEDNANAVGKGMILVQGGRVLAF